MGGIKKTHLMPLETLQKRFIKIIYNKPLRYPSRLLYNEADIMDIRQLYCKVVLTFLRVNGQYLTTVSHTYDTRGRSTSNVFLPRARKSIGQRYFVHIGPRFQKIMPAYLKTINSINMFKKKVKNWILTDVSNQVHSIID